ncbi:MAG: transaldolase family protein [Microbacterium ginsengisoli]|jgi:transaldolase|uniref:transaldolase family protein n=1 Tax=Microbacterium TaxID=33882 RepID=UPI0006FAE233|nr:MULTISPECIES: transaldolase family protein [unclassified Microbacterium]MBN9198304.1 transaldolase family protein [Microbacterium ginsengisoli]KQR94047.1 transaldolase [Microbacterium sp. Leaf347]KQR97101.1 transaldolase [Microbacterium sp. Leaf351]ODU79416.1 MAG: transaldolase [Microbacterium sp. SCN 71-21]OJU78267.1 MAG: transaldolase [Microbacterium sp. 71-23]
MTIDTDAPLARAAATTPTSLWNDSADPDELAQSIAFGAVGATCNPVIALTAITKRPDVWGPRLRELADEHPTWGESELGWAAVRELSVAAARLLEPAFAASGGRNGRLSIQTDPRLHRDRDALVAQAVEFSTLAPNIIVKIPATATGVAAMEEAAYRGVSINATLSFTVPQALAVGAALERALDRRAADGLEEREFGHVVTIMGGRLDDWLKKWANAQRILTTPGVLDWAGVAALKRAHHLFRERGYRSRILSAAFRNALQWSELVGGDLVVSPPFDWQARINENRIAVADRIDVPVAADILAELETLSEFRRAYEPDGLAPEEFATFGASRNTLRQFLEADAQLDALVRDILVPAA